VYLSEKATADSNFCLGHMMKEAGAFEKHVDLAKALELYFMFCSIELNAHQMATLSATLANAGICPLTEEPVLKPPTVRNCLSLMASCGLYDFSGEFAFNMGFPAKSGVSGALMIVIPNLMVPSPFPFRFSFFLSFFYPSWSSNLAFTSLLGYLCLFTQARQAWKLGKRNQIL